MEIWYSSCGALLFQLPSRDIFGGIAADEQQKSKLVSTHPPNNQQHLKTNS